MSEVMLTILDAKRAIHGRIHGSDADRAIAALAAEPETIEELDLAMRRFTESDDASHFSHFGAGDSDRLWDAGLVIIDLAARLVAAESTYSAISTSGSVCGPSPDMSVDFRLSDDWAIEQSVDCWRDKAQTRRQDRASRPRLDARQVLFGQPMMEYIVNKTSEVHGMESDKAITKVHADWLTTARDDLGGLAPRDIMLQYHDFLTWDLQYREMQWSVSGRPPLGLNRATAAYKYAGFATHEIVIYYELMRHLLWACRHCFARDGEWNRTDEVRQLEELRDAWLESPDPEMHGRTPASVIDRERRRMPEGVTGAEAAVDPDCPCCQMMAEDMGPYFWHLDGCDMDDEFAFSFCETLEEWADERRSREEFNRKFEAKYAQRTKEGKDSRRIWSHSFASEEAFDDLTCAQLVAVATLGFAAMVGELNRGIRELADDAKSAASQQETLNRLLANLREALAKSPELIDPTLDRLAEELVQLGEQYPTIDAKCADLSRRLREFPSQLAASAARGDVP